MAPETILSSETAVECINHWFTAEQKRLASAEKPLSGKLDAYADFTVVDGKGKPMSPMAKSRGLGMGHP